MEKPNWSWGKWFPILLLLGLAVQRAFVNLQNAITNPDLFTAFGKVLIISPLVWAGLLTVATVLVILGLIFKSLPTLRAGAIGGFAIWILGAVAALSVGAIGGFLVPCTILYLFFGYIYINARDLTRRR